MSYRKWAYSSFTLVLWSSSVVVVNGEEPSRGNDVGGEAGAGETSFKKKKAYGKVRNCLS